MTNTRKLLLKGASWIAVARISINLIALASTLILARLLVPADFGLVAIAESFAVILAAITELSLSNALIQHDNPEERHFHTAWTLNIARSAILAVVMAGFSLPLASIYGDARLTPVLLVLAGATLLGGLENPKLVYFQRNLVFWQEFVLDVGTKIAGFIMAVGIAVVFRSYWALILGSVAGTITRVALSYSLVRYRPRFSIAAHRDLLSFSIWLTLATAVQTINKRSVPLAIGLFVSSASLGQYSMGARLGQLPIQEGIGPVRKVLFPAFSRIKNDLQRLRASYVLAHGALCTLAFPIAGGLAVLAEPIVLTLIGEKWLPAVPILQLISVAAALEVMESTNHLAMAVDRTKSLFHRNLRVFAIRIPLIMAGALIGSYTFFGIVMGVVYGRFAASVVNMIWNMQLVRNFIGLSLRQQFAVGFRPAIATVTMAAALLPFSINASDRSDIEILVLIAGLVLAGAAIYVGTLFVIWFASGRPRGPETELLRLAEGIISKS